MSTAFVLVKGDKIISVIRGNQQVCEELRDLQLCGLSVHEVPVVTYDVAALNMLKVYGLTADSESDVSSEISSDDSESSDESNESSELVD